jgi:hypothetical protein
LVDREFIDCLCAMVAFVLASVALAKSIIHFTGQPVFPVSF